MTWANEIQKNNVLQEKIRQLETTKTNYETQIQKYNDFLATIITHTGPIEIYDEMWTTGKIHIHRDDKNQVTIYTVGE